MEALFYCTYQADGIGTLYIVTNGVEIVSIEMSDEDFENYCLTHDVILDEHSELSRKIYEQFDEYFHGKRTKFTLPLAFKGTPFQESVWKVLQEIPYGETWSYLDVATNIGKPKACRAVGQANRANPIPIIIPCHRVIGKNKRLTGYAGTRIDLKEKLLLLEGAVQFKK